MLVNGIGTITLQTNISILYVYDTLPGLNSAMNTYVQQTIFPYVKNYFAKLLSVYSTRNYDFTGITTC